MITTIEVSLLRGGCDLVVDVKKLWTDRRYNIIGMKVPLMKFVNIAEKMFKHCGTFMKL